MKRTPAETVVEFLSFSGDVQYCTSQFKTFSHRRWQRVLQWMDDHGLAFYFLQRVKDTKTTDAIPDWVRSRLDQTFDCNRRRVDDLSRRFDKINNKFHDAGIPFAVLKGFSLVPQFCPNASLRYQGDLDYLVDDPSLMAAQRVLIEAGYSPKPQISNQEITFLLPGAGKASRRQEQYSPQAPHAVELHLDIWDSELNRLPLLERQFSVERAITHQWNGLAFPALSEEDAFLLQVLHVCRHLFTYWVRMSCLYEIGYFLSKRAADTAFWRRLDERAGQSRVLRELIVVVTELTVQLFAPSVPLAVRAWVDDIRPATRIWIEKYARRCAFSEVPVYEFTLFPKSKLVLFLHQQYQNDCAQKNVLRSQLVVPSRLSRLVSSVKSDPSLLLNPGWWKRQLFIRRGLFHALAGLRYVCEIPRWRWLNRPRVRAASASG